jgi:hypothetical protein
MKMNTATRSAVARIPQDRIVPCMLLASVLAGTAARAQSVDYGAME